MVEMVVTVGLVSWEGTVALAPHIPRPVRVALYGRDAVGMAAMVAAVAMVRGPQEARLYRSCASLHA